MKIETIFIAVILLAGAFALPLSIANAQSQDYTLVAFAGDFDCGSSAEESFKQVASSNVDLFVVLGDMSYNDNNIDCFEDLVNDNNLKSKTIAVIGNHEAPEDGTKAAEDQAKSFFGLPSKGYTTTTLPLGNTGSKAVFIQLYTQESISSGSTQYQWLKQQLDALKQDSNAKYVIVAQHKLMWDDNNKCDHGTESYAKNVRDLLYQYGELVDLDIYGHDHCFMLSKPLKTGDTVTTNDDVNSLTFILSGLGGKSADSAESPGSQTLDAFGGSSNYGVSYIKLYNAEEKIDYYFKTNKGETKAVNTLLNTGISPPVEICNDGIDNDGDGLIDIQDPDCTSPEICTDGIDNDGDGLIDQLDPDCQIPQEEICGNGIDDDGDGLIDEDCPTGGQGILNPTTIVASKQDNGKEGDKVNDNDFSTRWSAEGVGETIKFTFNGTYPITKVGLTGFHYDKSYTFEIEGKEFIVPADRPQDQLIFFDLKELGINADTITLVGKGNSGSDYNSYREIHFYTEELVNKEICGNNIDDDGNGAIDDGCPAEICGDGIDNDGDGQIDENCPTEICGDNVDNNGNGQIDENCLPKEVNTEVILSSKLLV